MNASGDSGGTDSSGNKGETCVFLCVCVRTPRLQPKVIPTAITFRSIIVMRVFSHMNDS